MAGLIIPTWNALPCLSNLIHPLRPSSNVISYAEPLPYLFPCPLPESSLFILFGQSILFTHKYIQYKYIYIIEYHPSTLQLVTYVSVLPAQDVLLQGRSRRSWGMVCPGSSRRTYVSTGAFNVRILKFWRVYQIIV